MPLRPALAVLVAAAAAAAQQSVYPVRDVAIAYDSGFLANPTPVEQVVWSQDVTVAGDWLQLHFADTHLDGASHLRIFPPALPAFVQRHDARSIVDYRWYSCQFVGPTLRVELVAAPGTSANRTRIDRAIAMDVGSPIEPDTICGTTDDRVLGSDPRQCRLNAGCTAWLFSEYAVGTAGHCMSSTAGQILHCNVPLSTAAGSPVPAHPNDQYAMAAFHPFLNAGVGQDWSVSAAVRNSNTNLFPGQAQGSWYTVAPAPAFVDGQQIRITGYGSGNGVSGSPTWNLVQKTLVGPRLSTATATALRYGTDTTGGNSGSPILFEATGEVIGIHTHGGCSSTGGGNLGTDAVRADFTAARTQVAQLHTVGAVTAYGTGCGSPTGVPLLTFAGIPEIARPVTLVVSQLRAAAPVGGLLAIGSSATVFGGSPLPLDLAFAGMAGCQLLVGYDLTDAVVSSGGVASKGYLLPNDPAMVGGHAFVQFFGLDPTAPNAVGVVASNGIDVFVGN